eukprot:4961296-Amphidinium_carterae.1
MARAGLHGWRELGRSPAPDNWSCSALWGGDTPTISLHVWGNPALIPLLEKDHSRETFAEFRQEEAMNLRALLDKWDAAQGEQEPEPEDPVEEPDSDSDSDHHRSMKLDIIRNLVSQPWSCVESRHKPVQPRRCTRSGAISVDHALVASMAQATQSPQYLDL